MVVICIDWKTKGRGKYINCLDKNTKGKKNNHYDDTESNLQCFWAYTQHTFECVKMNVSGRVRVSEPRDTPSLSEWQWLSNCYNHFIIICFCLHTFVHLPIRQIQIWLKLRTLNLTREMFSSRKISKIMAKTPNKIMNGDNKLCWGEKNHTTSTITFVLMRHILIYVIYC